MAGGPLIFWVLVSTCSLLLYNGSKFVKEISTCLNTNPVNLTFNQTIDLNTWSDADVIKLVNNKLMKEIKKTFEEKKIEKEKSKIECEEKSKEPIQEIESDNSSLDRDITSQPPIKVGRLIVDTKSGRLEGKLMIVLGKNIFTFLGIPYAQPPVGELRFAKSKPNKWTGIKQAMNFSLMCPHQVLPRKLVPMDYVTEMISEDCLTLNIWSPSLRPKQLKTVMLWVHGGAFNYNSANLRDTDGRVLAAFGDVVVVTVNYRVGALGFLDSGIVEAPGNMGIYDQSLAINWVKENINNFGGDPEKLVLFGQSAGSISIGLLMTYNATMNLFSRAILQSGSPLMAGVLFSKTREYAERFAMAAGCSNKNENLKKNPKKVVECLKHAPLRVILEAEKQILSTSNIAFVPTTKGALGDIRTPGRRLQEKNLFENIKEVLFGLVPEEGSWLVHVANPEVFKRHSIPDLVTLEQTRNAFFKLATEKLGLPKSMANLVSISLINGPESDKPFNNVRRLYSVVGDTAIGCPTVFLADELVARNKSVYGYQYYYRPKNTKFGLWQGISHYQEVPFVFGYPIMKRKKFEAEDIEMSKRIMTIWTTFAKNGHPPSQFNLNWPSYSDNESYMMLESNKSSVVHSYHKKSCDIFKASFQIFS